MVEMDDVIAEARLVMGPKSGAIKKRLVLHRFVKEAFIPSIG